VAQEARKLLKIPVGNTIYFAGEAFEGTVKGTVGLAVCSGTEVAALITKE